MHNICPNLLQINFLHTAPKIKVKTRIVNDQVKRNTHFAKCIGK